MANELLVPTHIGRPSSAATEINAEPFMGTTTATTNYNITPLSCKYSEQPCEKYQQFINSSAQERTLMIENLVDTFAKVIDSIWQPKFLIEHQKTKVMPTRGFCNEILKRSKATYSTVQISLFYIFRVKNIVHEKLLQRIKMQTSTPLDDLMCCGRRMFLASLMVASKYLHDKNYHNKAWSKITGLDIKEINAAEMAFLKLIDYKLYISKPTFDQWYTRLHASIQKGIKQQTTMKHAASDYPSPPSSQPQQQNNPFMSPPSYNSPIISCNVLTTPPSTTGIKRKLSDTADDTSLKKLHCQ